MNINFTIRNLLIALAALVTVVVIFLVHALGGLGTTPVDFSEPPAFVEQYAAKMDFSEPSSALKNTETAGGHINKFESLKITTDFSKEETLVLNLILDGESPNVLLRMFTHTIG